MEVAGLVASVVTLVQTANFVRRTLSDYKTGGKDRDRLLAEVDGLKLQLDRLKADNENAVKSGKQEPWFDIVSQLSQSGGTLEQIEDVISEVKLKVERRPGLRGKFVLWTWPFVKEDVDRNVRQMQRLSRTVAVVLQDASWRLTLAISESVKRVDKVTTRRETMAILDWLSPLNFLQQQQTDSLKAFPGTCEWFLASPEFIAWKQRQQRVLFCSAIGGAGKTILASVTINDLRMAMARQDAAIFIIYCKHDKPDTHSVDKLAMTILRQLVQLKACQVPPDLEELLEQHYYTNETRPSLDEVLKIVNAHLLTFSRTFIVVDGLDEITTEEARECIITFLMKLEGAPQLMFTSRPIDMIEKMFLSTAYGDATDDTGSDDDEEEGDILWGDDDETDYDYYSDSYDEGIGERDSSDESSDQSSANSPVVQDPQSAPMIATMTPDVSMSSNDKALESKDENTLPCSKCDKPLGLLQYRCGKCLRKQSIICVDCYETGTRCVTGDSSHDVSIGLRTRCLKMDVSARPRAIRKYVRSRIQQSTTVLMKFVTLKPGFAEEIEDIVTYAAQKM